jgi:hypothetical protein
MNESCFYATETWGHEALEGITDVALEKVKKVKLSL